MKITLPDIIKGELIQSDIDKGETFNPYKCPFALAIIRRLCQLFPSIYSKPLVIVRQKITKIGDKRYINDDNMSLCIQRYDINYDLCLEHLSKVDNTITPCSFTLTLDG